MGVLTLKTTRFGEIAVDEERVYTFVDGLLGFPDVRQYALLDPPQPGPFQWMQAVESDWLAFLVCDPHPFFPDYRVAVRPEDLAPIQLAGVEHGLVLTIVTVTKAPEAVTANLLGPLIFNVRGRLARQMVLTEGGYTTRHPLAPSAPASGSAPGPG